MTTNGSYIGADGGWLPDSTAYKVRAGVLLTLLGLHIIYAIVILVLFIIKAKDRHSGLAQRSVALVTFQTVALFCVGSAGLISTSIPKWPCFLRLWLINIGDALLFASIAARAIQHIVISNVHTLTNEIASNTYAGFRGGMAQQQQNATGPAYLTHTTRPVRSATQSSVFSNEGFDLNSNRPHTTSALGRSNTSSRSEKTKRNTLVLTNPLQGNDDDMCSQSDLDIKLYRKLKRYTRMQRYVSDKALSLFLLGHIVAMSILSLVTNIVDDQFSLKPLSMSCSIMWGFLPVVGVDGFYVVFVLPILLVKCWSQKDAYGIRNDLLISIIVGSICLVLTIIWETALFRVAEQWSGWFFSWVCAIVLHTTSLALPLWNAMRHSRDVLHRMHGADALDPVSLEGTSMATAIANAAGGTDIGRRTEFNAILSDPYEYRFFCAFAASCFCSELTAFVDEYQSLKNLTVIALGSEDIWREDADRLDPGYMSRMANNIDNGIGFLALANRDHPNSKALRLQTPPTVCILETARAVYPQYDLSEVTPFPVAAMDKLVAMFSVFVNSSSHTAVSLPSAMVLRIREQLGRSQLTLTIFDEIKDEVLNMLYFDVFTRYARQK
ncbi:hypothetical protein EV175_005754 [Coemansia sp. RSA 1933]|nr:hypothetical protein EV175_005754 [Coemansia sp. RSA 1933]